MAVFFKIENNFIVFFGDTFNHRPAIKSLGARWNGTDKTWILSDTPEAREQAAQIARPMPGSADTRKNNDADTRKKNDTDAATSQSPPLKNSPAINMDPSMGVSVSQLMAEADKIISQGFPTPAWVIGEIQSISRRGGGTLYFDFADAKTGAHQTATVTIKCNVWQSNMSWLEKRHGKEKIESVFQDGNHLRALVQVKLYKDRGQLSLTIEDIDPTFTQGALALARAELLKKLRASGLDRKNKSLSVPAFPFKVALITAQDSRAHSDFTHQLTAGGEFPGELIFIPCPMQGDNVPRDVTKSIKRACEAGADLIVLSRGGGSAADLRWFDGEEIALAIAHAEVPVIAAIGHHDDHSVAEDVAHTREKTPTAAAERVLEIFRDTRRVINERAHSLAVILDREVSRFEKTQSDLRERLTSATEAFFARHRERLGFLLLSLQRSFDGVMSAQESYFTRTSLELNHHARQWIQRLSEGLFEREQKLIRLDPGPWLDSGWTQISHNGSPIKSIADVEPTQEVTARIRDGVLKLKVTSKEERQKEGSKQP